MSEAAKHLNPNQGPHKPDLKCVSNNSGETGGEAISLKYALHADQPIEDILKLRINQTTLKTLNSNNEDEPQRVVEVKKVVKLGTELNTSPDATLAIFNFCLDCGIPYDNEGHTLDKESEYLKLSEVLGKYRHKRSGGEMNVDAILELAELTESFDDSPFILALDEIKKSLPNQFFESVLEAERVVRLKILEEMNLT